MAQLKHISKFCSVHGCFLPESSQNKAPQKEEKTSIFAYRSQRWGPEAATGPGLSGISALDMTLSPSINDFWQQLSA